MSTFENGTLGACDEISLATIVPCSLSPAFSILPPPTLALLDDKTFFLLLRRTTDMPVDTEMEQAGVPRPTAYK